MSWRRVPPVYSPVSITGLMRGTVAALLGTSHARDVSDGLAAIYKARATVLTDSGTSALVMALRIAAGDRGTVAMPGYACIDLIAAAIRSGVRVRLYDTDPQTLSPDLDSLEDALGRGANAVVVAPLFGYPLNMHGVLRVSRKFDAVVIEDAAQSAGATLDGARVGSRGDLAVLSFGRGKGTTGGAGGALLVHDARLITPVQQAAATLPAMERGVREVVALAAQWVLARPSLYALPASIPSLHLGEMVYHEAHEPGALSASSGAIVRTAFAMDARERAHRQDLAALYADAAARSRAFLAVRPVPLGVPGYLRFAVLDAFGTARTAPELGAIRGYPMTLDEHRATGQVLASGECAGAGARVLRDRLVTLPTHSRVATKDARRLCAWLAADTPRA